MKLIDHELGSMNGIKYPASRGWIKQNQNVRPCALPTRAATGSFPAPNITGSYHMGGWGSNYGIRIRETRNIFRFSHIQACDLRADPNRITCGILHPSTHRRPGKSASYFRDSLLRVVPDYPNSASATVPGHVLFENGNHRIRKDQRNMK